MCQELTSPPSSALPRFLPHRPAAHSPHSALPAAGGPSRHVRGVAAAPLPTGGRTNNSKDKKQRCGAAPPAARALRAPPARACTQPRARARPRRPPPPRGPFSPGPSGGAGFGAALGGSPRSSPAAGGAAGPARGGPERERSGAASRRRLQPRARPRRALPRAPSVAATQAGPGARAAPRCPPAAPRYLAAGAAPAPPGASASARVFSTSRDESPRGAAPERGSMSGALPPPSRGRPPPERAGSPHPARPGGGGEGAAGPSRAGPSTDRGPGAGKAGEGPQAAPPRSAPLGFVRAEKKPRANAAVNKSESASLVYLARPGGTAAPSQIRAAAPAVPGGSASLWVPAAPPAAPPPLLLRLCAKRAQIQGERARAAQHEASRSVPRRCSRAQPGSAQLRPAGRMPRSSAALLAGDRAGDATDGRRAATWF